MVNQSYKEEGNINSLRSNIVVEDVESVVSGADAYADDIANDSDFHQSYAENVGGADEFPWESGGKM